VTGDHATNVDGRRDGASSRTRPARFALRFFLVNAALLAAAHLAGLELLAYIDRLPSPELELRYTVGGFLLLGAFVGSFGGMVVGTAFSAFRPDSLILLALIAAFQFAGCLAAGLTWLFGLGAVGFFAGSLLALPLVEAAAFYGPKHKGGWILVGLSFVGLAGLFAAVQSVSFDVMSGAEARVFYVVADVVLVALWSLAPLFSAPPCLDPIEAH